jgi:hypothetical protein
VLYPPELRGRKPVPIPYQGGRIQRHGACVRCVCPHVRERSRKKERVVLARTPLPTCPMLVRGTARYVDGAGTTRAAFPRITSICRINDWPPGRGDVHASLAGGGGTRGSEPARSMGRRPRASSSGSTRRWRSCSREPISSTRGRARPFLSRVERSLLPRPRPIRGSVGVPVTCLRAVRAGHTGDREREA